MIGGSEGALARPLPCHRCVIGAAIQAIVSAIGLFTLARNVFRTDIVHASLTVYFIAASSLLPTLSQFTMFQKPSTNLALSFL